MLRVNEINELRYAVETDGHLALLSKMVLQAEAARRLAAAEHEKGRVTADPNERALNAAAAGVHQAMADYCLSCAAVPPRPKLECASSSAGEPASPHGPTGDGKPLDAKPAGDAAASATDASAKV